MLHRDELPVRVKAVMIDLDGTLLDTVADLTTAVNLMLHKLGGSGLSETQVRIHIGKGMPNLIRRSLEHAFGSRADDALFERAMPVYVDCYHSVNGDRTTPYPGVLEGLESLRKERFPLACVTNKSERFTLPLLRKMRLADFFSVVVCGDTVAKRKPDPLPLIFAAEKLGVTPRDMLMVGDSVNDAQAARAAGCPVFCVPYGYNEGADVRGLDVDAIVETIFEATKLITKA
jgi:phosphoglycolate phosphatase